MIPQDSFAGGECAEAAPEQLDDGFSPPPVHGEDAAALQFGEPELELTDTLGEKSDF
ncbi:MAG: hypothetical protein HYX47_19690 [Burkholderiales bacterium]|nr:hypothetical protein [Burkholderiales bacterium]